jgi:hypothetical protein
VLAEYPTEEEAAEMEAKAKLEESQQAPTSVSRLMVRAQAVFFVFFFFFQFIQAPLSNAFALGRFLSFPPSFFLLLCIFFFSIRHPLRRHF